jgi:Mor family transcriptional regulator
LTANEFLIDIAFVISKAFYKEGYDLVESESISKSVTEAVFIRFQGEQIYIPNYRGLNLREQVVSLWNDDKTISEIARATGYSPRHVYNLINDRKNPDRRGKNNSKGSDILIEMKMSVAKAMLQKGIEPETLKKITQELLGFIQKHWGGFSFEFCQVVAVKKGAKLIRKQDYRRERTGNVYEDYKKGMSYGDLSTKYCLEPPQVREIVKRKLKKDRETLQIKKQ